MVDLPCMKLKMLPPTSTPFSLHRVYIYIYCLCLSPEEERDRRRRRTTRGVAAPSCAFSSTFFLFLQTNFFPRRFFRPRLTYPPSPRIPFLRPHSARPGSRINTVFAARFYANVIRLFAICPGKFCRRCNS